MLKDNFGREADYLRLGITDRCNLRCTYCMPEKGINFARQNELLTYEEIYRLSVIFKKLGIKKIRLTGGEPFVRKDLIKLIEIIRPFYASFHITTNATLIGPHLKTLRSLNVNNLNISLDSLDPAKFYRITRRDSFRQVYDNIFKAIDLGFNIKLNIVVMKGVNDDEIIGFTELSRTFPLSVRFIEAMPFNGYSGNRDCFMNYLQVLDILQKKLDLQTVVQKAPSSAIEYQVPGYSGNIALIPAYTRSLCGSCNRIRLTSTGKILNCLYSNSGLDVKHLLRKGEVDNSIERSITEFVYKKKKDGFQAEEERKPSEYFESMTTIGG